MAFESFKIFTILIFAIPYREKEVTLLTQNQGITG